MRELYIYQNAGCNNKSWQLYHSVQDMCWMWTVMFCCSLVSPIQCLIRSRSRLAPCFFMHFCPLTKCTHLHWPWWTNDPHYLLKGLLRSVLRDEGKYRYKQAKNYVTHSTGRQLVAHRCFNIWSVILYLRVLQIVVGLEPRHLYSTEPCRYWSVDFTGDFF